MTGIVDAVNLSQRYDKILALNNLNLSLEQGTTTAFIGPDGVGKSTLLALIAGAKRIQDGNLFVLGGDVRLQAVQS
ncbi:MAG: ATP-binding cassette domain-containing protein, partial [Caedimonadaceae bacterium]